MEISLNKASPAIMHIDLNSCFATVEQQSHPHLRGKPIAIAPLRAGAFSPLQLKQKNLELKLECASGKVKKFIPI